MATFTPIATCPSTPHPCKAGFYPHCASCDDRERALVTLLTTMAEVWAESPPDPKAPSFELALTLIDKALCEYHALGGGRLHAEVEVWAKLCQRARRALFASGAPHEN